MHAFLFTGSDKTKRAEKMYALLTQANISPFDYVVLEDQDTLIGIKEIREFTQKLFSLPTQSPYLAGIIKNGTILTIPAQQALLKTIEEPPAHVQIYIAAENEEDLLPTILSRCEVVRLTNQAVLIDTAIISILAQSVGNRILALSKIPKEHLTSFCDNAILSLRDQFLRTSDQKLPPILKKLLIAKKYAKNNVSMVHLLEDAFCLL